MRLVRTRRASQRLPTGEIDCVGLSRLLRQRGNLSGVEAMEAAADPSNCTLHILIPELGMALMMLGLSPLLDAFTRLITHQTITQPLSGESLIAALRRGGYVLVMRHASATCRARDEEVANPDNLEFERQLDRKGRATAIAMGKAIRELKIPIGRVFASPSYRALETARLAQLPTPRVRVELGDRAQTIDGVAEQAAWLRKKTTESSRGTNTVLLTHLPNIAAAFPETSPALSDGETLVFDPHTGAATVVARIGIDYWPRLRR